MAPRNTEYSYWQVNYPEIKMRSAHLLRSHDWTDCTFRFEMEAEDSSGVGSLDAHKLILAMASPVFAAMFYGKVGDDKAGPVSISDIDQETFARMLDYIYTDEVVITSSELAIDLFRAANKYILVHHEKRCMNYLFDKVNPQNVCYVYEFSVLFQETELEQKCLEIFTTQTREVLKGLSFKHAQIDTLMKIYSMDSLNIDNELDLYYALLEYSSNNKILTEKTEEMEIKGKQFNTVEDKELLNPLKVNDSGKKLGSDVVCEEKPVKKDEKESKTDDETSTSAGYVNNKCICSMDVAKARENYKDKLSKVIKLIRFLSLTPSEFAECKNLFHLITKEEVLALCMNISSPKTEIPIPAGFSASRMPRKEGKKGWSSWTERITLQNLSKIKTFESKLFNVRNIPWKVEMKTFYKKAGKGTVEKRLQVDIVCLLNLKLSWTLNAELGIRMIPHVTNIDNMTEITRSFATELSRENDGTETTFSWKLLTDPSFGVSKDDTLVMEVYVASGDITISQNEIKECVEYEATPSLELLRQITADSRLAARNPLRLNANQETLNYFGLGVKK